MISTSFLLNWPITAVSLINMILLLWLGSTVLLNAENRNWGIWLTSGGLMLGAAFFMSHTAIIGLGLAQLTWRNMVFWWTVGLVPAILLPLAWYVVMLWYAGFWNSGDNRLRRRQWPGLLLVTGMAAAGLLSLGLGIVLIIIPFPDLANLRTVIRWSVGDVPLLALGFAVYVVLCIGLSLDALRRPAPSRRIMGAEARQRARPWLVASGLALLLVSWFVAGVMVWIVQDVNRRSFYDIYVDTTNTIAILDLIISSVICLSVLLLGQAIASYELFTGKTLPRRGLQRQWQRVVLLAVSYGVLVGGSLAISLRPIYSLLLTTVLMTLAVALFSWRTYVERERMMAGLRPFTGSQRLYDQLLSQSAPQDVDLQTPFTALCQDVLDTQVAYLAALGPLAPLMNAPLVYPDTNKGIPPALTALTAQFDTAVDKPVAVAPAQYAGAIWALSLWNERGLAGVLLLGEKSDGGLYTQEEMETARAIGERLLDLQASAELGSRLMRLQRERLAHTQVIDQQTRRVLHDDILPELQTALIALSGTGQGGEAVETAVHVMTSAHKRISDLLHEMPTVSAPDVDRLGLIPALRKVVSRELAQAFTVVSWEITPEAEVHLAQLPNLTAEVVFYAAREAIRNAAKYGAGDGKQPLTLTITAGWREQAGVQLQIRDDGVGMGAKNGRVAGAGQGLALHSAMMAVIGGELTVETAPGQYTAVSLWLPA